MLLNALSFVTQRRIPQPLSAVHAGLADRVPLGSTALLVLDSDGFLHIDEPFRPVNPFSWRQPTPSWCARARLLTNRGRFVAAVDLEVSMWSRDSSDLQLRPSARHPERWPGIRIRRYFALAHRGADETARLLTQRALTKGAERRVRVWGRERLRTAEGDPSPFTSAASPARPQATPSVRGARS